MYGKEGTAVLSGKCCIRRIIMTEREKMLAGLLYDCGDDELLARCIRPKI